MYPTCEGEKGAEGERTWAKGGRRGWGNEGEKCKGREVLVCLLCLMTMAFIFQALSKDAIGMERANALY